MNDLQELLCGNTAVQELYLVIFHYSKAAVILYNVLLMFYYNLTAC